MGAVTRQSAYPPTGEASGTNTMKKRRKQLNISTPLIYSPTATSPKEGGMREALKERLASIGQDGAYNAIQYLKKINQTQEEIVYSDSWLTKVKTDFQSGNPHSVSQHDCLQANPDSTKSERFSGSHHAPHPFRLFDTSLHRIKEEERRKMKEGKEEEREREWMHSVRGLFKLKNNKGIFNEEQQPALDQRNQSQATMPSE
ncbi:Retroelement silencing factor 1 [Dissostichus eleginoides]|uniref:Retroelement silencing factor 1 n=1 Tax=Dissostichus eleginoides TaxID=100907 RepID=A0AAD9B523_DISEL|nr:Retroelement silencing factor 1 [Dissostichus eleginoides]